MQSVVLRHVRACYQEDRDLVLSTISALEKCEADPVTPKKDECNGVH